MKDSNTNVRTAAIFFAVFLLQGSLSLANTYDDMKAAEDAKAIASKDVPARYKEGSTVQLKSAGSGRKSLYTIKGFGPNGELILNNSTEYSTRITVQQSDVNLPVIAANGFMVGDRVETSYTGRVRIVSLFPDGTAVTEGLTRGMFESPTGVLWQMSPGEFKPDPSMSERVSKTWKLNACDYAF